MANLLPGTKIQRLTPSSTGRNITPGMIGVVGGLNPSQHDNSNWMNWSFQRFPVQWENGLWSSLDPMEEQEIWEPYTTMPSSFNMAYPQNDPDNAQDYQGGIA